VLGCAAASVVPDSSACGACLHLLEASACRCTRASTGGRHSHRGAAGVQTRRPLTTRTLITLQPCAHGFDGPAHLHAGQAPPGVRAPDRGAASGGDEDNWAAHAAADVINALGGTASLAGACRALAATLVRAGALGAAVSLAQRFVLAHEGERKNSAALAAKHMLQMLRDVGRHVPEVCTPCNIPCSHVALAAAGVLSGGGARPAAPLLDEVEHLNCSVHPACSSSML
jgi:hypothetical protein